MTTEQPDTELLTTTRDAIYRIAIATDDQIAHTINLLDALKQRVRELSGLYEGAMIERIQDKGEIVVGSVRYYVGTERKVKCRDVARCLDALLVSVGGDFGALAKLLSSDPIKQGACKPILAEEWDKHFEVTEKLDLKEGSPKRSLMKADQAFLR